MYDRQVPYYYTDEYKQERVELADGDPVYGWLTYSDAFNVQQMGLDIKDITHIFLTRDIVGVGEVVGGYEVTKVVPEHRYLLCYLKELS